MARLTVVQVLPALNAGGVERATLEIGRALVAAGHRSLVISAGGRLVPRLQDEGSTHIPLDLGRKSVRTLLNWLPLRRLLRQLAPDIVHTRSRLPAWLARYALPPGGHWVSTVHGLNSPGRYSGVLTHAERVICVSETVRQHVLRQWPRTDPARLQVIPRGIDANEFPRDWQPDAAWRAQWARQYPALAGGRVLLLPGRGTRLKGHADGLRLLAGLRQSGIDARLWMPGARQAGREAYVAELEALALSLRVSDVIAITPPRADMRDAYGASDLVLQLSRQPEAFGRTVMEALAIGRPVLGWDHGGVGEQLRQSFPRGAVALGDVDALIERATDVLRAPVAPAATVCDLAGMQSATLELYERLLQR